TEVDHYSKVRDEVRLASGDYIDLKAYEADMRHLIDTYIRAEESEKISAFDDMSLIDLIVERGPDAVNALPKGIRKHEEAVAETIDNNVRKLIINESPVDPAYYDKMSKLLDALIEQRRKGVVTYKEYLEKIATLTREAKMPGGGPGGYPASLKTAAQRALYNNLGKDELLALAVDVAIRGSLQNGWKSNPMKTKRVRIAIRGALSAAVLPPVEPHVANENATTDIYMLEKRTDQILELAKNQHEY
ncbi:MAG TPA: hypothetical protein PL187_23770, partial [Caldilinea sp.]|nr:hypothetical protein [Caldilinea sp.]